MIATDSGAGAVEGDGASRDRTTIAFELGGGGGVWVLHGSAGSGGSVTQMDRVPEGTDCTVRAAGGG
jgi:hypothetical protein